MTPNSSTRFSINCLSPNRCRFMWLGVAAMLTLCVGCQPATDVPLIPTYPTSGKLLIDGKPASGAMIKFYDAKQRGRVATAIVREDGSFFGSFNGNEDGIPVGEYKLLILWMEPPADGGLPQDRLRGRFCDPERPVATVSITEGENKLGVISLP